MREEIFRILILTAGFGEGHNSAARSLAQCIEKNEHNGIACEVLDLISHSHPSLNKVLRKGYDFAVNNTPSLWKGFYKVSGGVDMSRDNRRRPQIFSWLRSDLNHYLTTRQPNAVISTYPIYNLLIERLHGGNRPPFPTYTAITDSVSIHPIWTATKHDHFFVTDDMSRSHVIRQGISDSRITTIGFPVSPEFSILSNRRTEITAQPRILYLPTTRRTHVRKTLKSILLAIGSTAHLTVVLGKHADRLGATVRESLAGFPKENLTILGWTKRIPQLMSEHHVVISKAGGATVHERLAAKCPMIVNYITPGQEEGNVALLKHQQCGIHAKKPAEITGALLQLFEAAGRHWHTYYRNLLPVSRSSAADQIIQHILQKSTCHSSPVLSLG